MRRRRFITALGGAIVWPLAARAEASVKIARIGFLRLAPASAWLGEVNALRAGLRELGYIEGNNIVLDFRWATNVNEMSMLANELVRMNVDIIFAPASIQVEPARQATKTIPIVFAQLLIRSVPVTLPASPIQAATSPACRWFSPSWPPRALKS